MHCPVPDKCTTHDARAEMDKTNRAARQLTRDLTRALHRALTAAMSVGNQDRCSAKLASTTGARRHHDGVSRDTEMQNTAQVRGDVSQSPHPLHSYNRKASYSNTGTNELLTHVHSTSTQLTSQGPWRTPTLGKHKNKKGDTCALY